MQKKTCRFAALLWITGGLTAHAKPAPKKIPSLSNEQKKCYTDNGLTLPGEGHTAREKGATPQPNDQTQACLSAHDVRHTKSHPPKSSGQE